MLVISSLHNSSIDCDVNVVIKLFIETSILMTTVRHDLSLLSCEVTSTSIESDVPHENCQFVVEISFASAVVQSLLHLIELLNIW